MRALLAAGHDPNGRLSEGSTPLTVAAAAGETSIVTLLLDTDAKMDLRKDSWLNQDGRTALHWAAAGGHFESVCLLISRGASVVTADAEGRTPLNAAARSGHRGVVETSLQHGAAADARDRQAMTPRMETALGPDREDTSGVAEALMRALNNVAAIDHRGRTVLHWAASSNGADLVRTLIAHGAEVNIGTIDGDAALWWAAALGKEASVRVLLEAKGDPTVARHDGTTPQQVARQNGHDRVAALLER